MEAIIKRDNVKGFKKELKLKKRLFIPIELS
jgi:hypothetical protein